VTTRVPSGLNATAMAYADWCGRVVEIFPVARSHIGVLYHPALVNFDPSALKEGV
jgi:hypothetical protein